MFRDFRSIGVVGNDLFEFSSPEQVVPVGVTPCRQRRMTMTKTMQILAVMAATVLPTMAGTRFSGDVNITYSNVSGSLGAAHNSPDGMQYMSCTVYSYEDGSQ